MTGVAVALGPILGGVITSEISWRGIFLVNIPIGVIAVALTLWKVDESDPKRVSTGLVGLRRTHGRSC